MNKYFSLPGYCNNFLMVKLFIEYRDAHPELFIEDHIVESLYDFPSSLIWGGDVHFLQIFLMNNLKKLCIGAAIEKFNYGMYVLICF